MKEVTEQPKIDLAEIVILKAYPLAQCEINAENEEAHMMPSWTHQLGVLISDDQANQIAQAPAMYEAMQEFVHRVEKGEVRSRVTYAKFKAILAAARGEK